MSEGKQWLFTVDIEKLTDEQTTLMVNIYCEQYPEEPRDRVLSLFRHGLTVPDDHFKETYMYGRTLTREEWRSL